MAKIEVAKKKLNLDITKSRFAKKKIEDSYKKIKGFKKNFNKGITKSRLLRKNWR